MFESDFVLLALLVLSVFFRAEDASGSSCPYLFLNLLLNGFLYRFLNFSLTLFTSMFCSSLCEFFSSPFYPEDEFACSSHYFISPLVFWQPYFLNLLFKFYGVNFALFGAWVCEFWQMNVVVWPPPPQSKYRTLASLQKPCSGPFVVDSPLQTTPREPLFWQVNFNSFSVADV